MTRTEKYYEYRLEIKNEANILNKIAKDNELIQKYCNKINSIDKKILNNTKIDFDLINYSTTNNLINDDVKILDIFLKNIDQNKLSIISDDVNNLLTRFHFKTILNSNDKISEEWLSQDINYSNFIGTNNELNQIKDNWNRFQIESLGQIEKINNLKKNEDQYFNQFDNQSILDTNIKPSFSFTKIYFVLLISFGIIILIIIILLIILILPL